MEEQVDAILQAHTEVILLAGGTEGGASRSVARAVELINMVCRMLPKPERPVVIFVGNSALGDKVKEAVEKMDDINECEVNLVWEPAWDISMADDNVKKALGG